MNPLERTEIHVGVQAQAMITPSFLYAQPEGGNLRPLHVNAGGIATRHTLYALFGEELNNGIFHRLGQLPHVPTPACEINEEIGDPLSGTVIGHLTAAITADDGYGTGIENIRRVGIAPQGKDRRVLQEPDLIRGRFLALTGEGAHGIEHGKIGQKAWPAADGNWFPCIHRHSITPSISCTAA